jgi:hypothetical protein
MDSATIDLADRRTLVKSWLATLHGAELTIRPRLSGPLPAWGPLLRSAVSWHLAYALCAYAGALSIARGGADNAVANSLQSGGAPAELTMALVLWWGGVAITTGLWWVKVREARQQRYSRVSSR